MAEWTGRSADSGLRTAFAVTHKEMGLLSSPDSRVLTFNLTLAPELSILGSQASDPYVKGF